MRSAVEDQPARAPLPIHVAAPVSGPTAPPLLPAPVSFAFAAPLDSLALTADMSTVGAVSKTAPRDRDEDGAPSESTDNNDEHPSLPAKKPAQRAKKSASWTRRAEIIDPWARR